MVIPPVSFLRLQLKSLREHQLIHTFMSSLCKKNQISAKIPAIPVISSHADKTSIEQSVVNLKVKKLKK